MPTVRMLPADVTVEVPAGTRLIEAIRAAGRPIAAPCGDDLICARCAIRVLAGHVTRESAVERDVKARNRVAPESRLACALRVHDDLVVTADYWGVLPDAALLLVDHGSRRPEAHAHLEQLAEAIRQRRPERQVYLSHLELVEPSIGAALDRCVEEGVTRVDLLPLFLAPGRHVTHDLPEQVRLARERHPGLVVRMLPSLGERIELADWIVEVVAGDR